MIESLKKFFGVKQSLPKPSDSEIHFETADSSRERFIAKVKYKKLIIDDDCMIKATIGVRFISHPRSSNKRMVEFYEKTHTIKFKLWVYDISGLNKEQYKEYIESRVKSQIYLKGCSEFKEYKERAKKRELEELENYKKNILKDKIKEWR